MRHALHRDVLETLQEASSRREQNRRYYIDEDGDEHVLIQNDLNYLSGGKWKKREWYHPVVVGGEIHNDSDALPISIKGTRVRIGSDWWEIDGLYLDDVRIAEPSNVEPVVEGDTVIFRDIFQNIDVCYLLTPHRIKEQVVVKRNPFDGVMVSGEMFTVRFKTSGKQKFANVRAWDARRDLSLTESWHGNTYALSVPKQQMNGAVYPVVIDPTSYAASSDAYSAHQTSSAPLNRYVLSNVTTLASGSVHTDDGKGNWSREEYRSYIRFDLAAVTPSDAVFGIYITNDPVYGMSLNQVTAEVDPELSTAETVFSNTNGTLIASITAGNGWKTVNVTSYSQAHANGFCDFGLIGNEAASGENLTTLIASSEYDINTTLRPYLSISVGGGSGLSLVAVVSESTSNAENQPRSEALSRPYADSANNTEAIARMLAKIALYGDSANTAETVARALVIARTISESSNSTEAVANVLGIVGLNGDASNTTEATIYTKMILALLAESSSVSEAVVTAAVMLSMFGESSNTGESIVATAARLALSADTTGNPETVVVAAALLALVSDSSATSESILAALGKIGLFNDQSSVAESVVTSAVLLALASDTSNTAESIATRMILIRLFADTSSVSETVAFARSLVQLYAETSSMSESVTSASGINRSWQDSTSITESTLGVIFTDSIAYLAVINEALANTETSSGMRLISNSINDTSSVAEAVMGSRALLALFSDVSWLAEAMNTARSLVQVVTDPAATVDGAETAANKTTVVNESSSVIDAAIRNLVLTIVTGDTSNVNEAIEQARELAVIIEEIAATGDNQIPMLTMFELLAFVLPLVGALDGSTACAIVEAVSTRAEILPVTFSAHDTNDDGNDESAAVHGSGVFAHITPSGYNAHIDGEGNTPWPTSP